jgi:hypothetical protein
LSKNEEDGYQKDLVENPYEIYAIAYCHHCKKEKVIMRRYAKEEEEGIQSEHMTGNLMGVCVNVECRFYKDISKIKNWRKEDIEIPEMKKVSRTRMNGGRSIELTTNILSSA